jgi:hypothetical protein
MKYIILLLLVTCTSLKSEDKGVNPSPEVILNSARNWASYSEIIRAYKSVPETAQYGFEQQQALGFGLRSLDRVFDSLETATLEKGAVTNVRSSIIENRSIVDIALVGVMISLGETAKYQGNPTVDRLQATYKSAEYASEVANERAEAIRVMQVLLKLKIKP